LSEKALVEIGPVVGAHGILGEFKVAVADPASSSLLGVGTILVEGRGVARREMKLLKARRGRGTVVVRAEGVADRNAAEALRGAMVLVRTADMPPLAPGEYYMFELVGMSVVDAGGCALGVVTGLSSNNAQDLIEVTVPGGGVTLVPFVKGLVAEVRREARVIVVDAPEGLFE
jgi:16S rRNA processing protein RimM